MCSRSSCPKYTREVVDDDPARIQSACSARSSITWHESCVLFCYAEAGTGKDRAGQSGPRIASAARTLRGCLCLEQQPEGTCTVAGIIVHGHLEHCLSYAYLEFDKRSRELAIHTARHASVKHDYTFNRWQSHLGGFLATFLVSRLSVE